MGRSLKLVGVCGAIALAGCGGSKSSGLSKSQLAAKVNPICAQFRIVGRAIPVPPDFVTDPRAAARYLDQLITASQDWVGKLRVLDPESSLKSQFDSYVASLDHDLALLGSADAKAHAGDPAGLKILSQEDAYDKASSQPRARALGFTNCAR